MLSVYPSTCNLNPGYDCKIPETFARLICGPGFNVYLPVSNSTSDIFTISPRAVSLVPSTLFNCPSRAASRGPLRQPAPPYLRPPHAPALPRRRPFSIGLSFRGGGPFSLKLCLLRLQLRLFRLLLGLLFGVLCLSLPLSRLLAQRYPAGIFCPLHRLTGKRNLQLSVRLLA